MKELVEKLEGHTDHLLGCYLGLYEKYAFLKPMLFDNEVVSKFGTRSKARVFGDN